AAINGPPPRRPSRAAASSATSATSASRTTGRARCGCAARGRSGSRPISRRGGLPETLVDAAVEASRDGASEIAWAPRVLDRHGRAGGARGWRLLASRGFPEDVVAEVVGDADVDP